MALEEVLCQINTVTVLVAMIIIIYRPSSFCRKSYATPKIQNMYNINRERSHSCITYVNILNVMC